MKHNIVIFTTTAAALGMLAGSWTGGGFLHYLISFALGIIVGIPAAAALILTLKNRERAHPRHIGNGFAIGAVAGLVFLGLFFLSGLFVFERRESEVRSYVNTVLPLLDAHKKKHGQYPKTLDGLTDKKIPYYLGAREAYSSDGTSFRFYYETPDSLMGGKIFTSRDRSWVIAD